MISFRVCRRKVKPLLLLNLASSSRAGCFHALLPKPSSFSIKADALAEKLLSAQIGSIAFIRHGDTSKANVDFERQLTDVGRQQAAQAGATLYDRNDLKPFYRIVVCSPAPRVISTAQSFLEAANCLDYRLRTPDIAYDGTMQPQGSALFQKLGYASLRTYLDNEDAEMKAAAQSVLGDYASSIVTEICNTVEPFPETGVEPLTLLFFGHAIYLPSAALATASVLNCETNLDVILDQPTGHVEGYLVDVAQRRVEYLQRPRSS